MLITGGLGFAGTTAVSQGASFSLAVFACGENVSTNIRFNEAFLNYRVEYNSVCEGNMSNFDRVYESTLQNKDIRACRVSVLGPKNIDNIKYEKEATCPLKLVH